MVWFIEMLKVFATHINHMILYLFLIVSSYGIYSGLGDGTVWAKILVAYWISLAMVMLLHFFLLQISSKENN